MTKPHHVEITADQMNTVAGGSLVSKGWEASDLNGEIVFQQARFIRLA